MINRVVGGIFLIIGTCIGASMLALPTTTAPGGFFNACAVMLIAWLAMTYSSLILAEVNSHLPLKSNLMSMAHKTLGKYGALSTWLVYLFLLYTLLSAYISGGSELLANLLKLIHIQISLQMSALLFTLLFGFVVYHGIFLVDWVNRGLMSGKLLAFLLLCSLLLPHMNFAKLHHYPISQSYGSFMMIFTAFSYGIIIPSIRDYFNDDMKRLRIAILIGSLIPLFCYILWILVVQSTLNSSGENGLIAIGTSGQAVSLMVNALAQQINNSFVGMFVYLFTSICILTAFLGVSLSLTDFLADALKREKKGWNKFLIILITFIPPLIIVMKKPSIFVSSLSYAGILCITLLMLIPSCMAWSKRYIKILPSPYQVIGGKMLLIVNIVIACSLILFGIQHV